MAEVGIHETLKRQLAEEERFQSAVRESILRPVLVRPVANTVSYIHPDVTLGNQDFVVGQPTKLAYQLQKGRGIREATSIVYIRPMHNRSALLTSQANISYGNQVFNYLDSIGIGLIDDSHTGVKQDDTHKLFFSMDVSPPYPSRSDTKEEKTWGLATKSWMEIDIEKGALFDKLGIRTVPIVAMADIYEIEDENGNIVSVLDAKAKGLIAKNTVPVDVFRAWVTPYRLKEVLHQRDAFENKLIPLPQREHARRKAILLAAFEDMQSDTSIPQKVRDAISGKNGILDIDTYLEWFTEALGENVGKMHGHRISHSYLTELHNITLDARIVDLDSVTEDAPQNVIDTDKISLLSEYDDYYRKFLVGMPLYFPMEKTPEYYLSRTQDAYKKGIDSV